MSEHMHKVGCLAKIGGVLIIFALIALTHVYKQKLVQLEYLSKGIYEVDGTFVLGSDIYTVFMICEPPMDNETLEHVVIHFIEENNTIQEIKNRKHDDFGTMLDYVNPSKIILRFVKPSKKFPIGWDRGYENGWFSGRITDYTIIAVHMPWDSIDQSDYEFFFYTDRFQ